MILIGRKLDFRPKTIQLPEMIRPSYTVVRARWLRFATIILFTLCGGNGLRVPPVPIPNTEVKPQHVKGTWLVTARESRSPPHSIITKQHSLDAGAVLFYGQFMQGTYRRRIEP